MDSHWDFQIPLQNPPLPSFLKGGLGGFLQAMPNLL
jgi:hypothetical protein